MRVSLETLGDIAWGGLARIAAGAAGGRFVPVAKIMLYQSPVAGMVLEDAVRGSVADAALQPVARLVEAGSEAGALVGLPMLAGLVCVRPELYPVVRPMAAGAMKHWVVLAGPKMRELKRREEKFAAEMAEFGAEFGISIDDMLDDVFAPVLAAMAGSGAEQAAADGHPAG